MWTSFGLNLDFTQIMGDQPPSWFLSFSTTLDKKLDKISEDVQSIRNDIKELRATANFAADQAKLAIDRTTAAEKKIGELCHENLLLKNTVATLNAKVIDIECQSRRNNLIFNGIEETENEKWEECEEKLREILRTENLDNVHFERVHRIGMKTRKSSTDDKSNPDKPRSIIAKFTYYKEREQVWLSRYSLSEDQNIWITEDFPEAVKSKRRTLFPVLKAAQRSPLVKQASLRVDKLVIDGKTFTVDTMANLPAHLQPEKTAIVESDDSVVFFTKHAVFSNLHPMPIAVDGQSFVCNEQYFQYTKAVHFGDMDIADLIRKENNPYEMINLAKKIKNYKHPVWVNRAEKVLSKANQAKYSQNKSARETLIATGQKTLGEASSNMFYGTGVNLLAKDPTDCSKWKGKNIMGQILTEIRSSLIADQNQSADV